MHILLIQSWQRQWQKSRGVKKHGAKGQRGREAGGRGAWGRGIGGQEGRGNGRKISVSLRSVSLDNTVKFGL